jgi:hypothetical protein
MPPRSTEGDPWPHGRKAHLGGIPHLTGEACASSAAVPRSSASTSVDIDALTDSDPLRIDRQRRPGRGWGVRAFRAK